MTELEQKLIDELKRQTPYFRTLIKEQQPKDKIKFALIVDGVLDSVIYDPAIDKFTKIKYSVGVGDCSCSFGYKLFDDVEYKEIDLLEVGNEKLGL